MFVGRLAWVLTGLRDGVVDANCADCIVGTVEGVLGSVIGVAVPVGS